MRQSPRMAVRYPAKHFRGLAEGENTRKQLRDTHRQHAPHHGCHPARRDGWSSQGRRKVRLYGDSHCDSRRQPTGSSRSAARSHQRQPQCSERRRCWRDRSHRAQGFGSPWFDLSPGLSGVYGDAGHLDPGASGQSAAERPSWEYPGLAQSDGHDRSARDRWSRSGCLSTVIDSVGNRRPEENGT